MKIYIICKYATDDFEENYYLNYCCPRNYTPSQFMLFSLLLRLLRQTKHSSISCRKKHAPALKKIDTQTIPQVFALPQFNAHNVLKAIKGEGANNIAVIFLPPTPAGSHICSSGSYGGKALAEFLQR